MRNLKSDYRMCDIIYRKRGIIMMQSLLYVLGDYTEPQYTSNSYLIRCVSKKREALPFLNDGMVISQFSIRWIWKLNGSSSLFFLFSLYKSCARYLSYKCGSQTESSISSKNVSLTLISNSFAFEYEFFSFVYILSSCSRVILLIFFFKHVRFISTAAGV